ncbi:nucleotidyltransferase family protein [Pseudanabaena sp. FACHB-2040]|uniref:nucleotidyltransferase family protein n=1 Tax=Pseudanabaena sp. FACHB-2040 TaxID=2692859 RepID=UPI001689227A|nr:nucleotidyltransferase family protein [Pseudanabaena sp. FACHB-2040]MBD2259115.1 nucleotidyltransferase family protein [Pseudanabaena sp. FACHB-2040]
MTRDEVLALLEAHRDNLEALGVKSLDLFGSVARDEARPDSDVDFLVEFLEPGGYFQLFRVQHYLEDLLQKDIDLGTREALREHLREPVSKDIVRVFD